MNPSLMNYLQNNQLSNQTTGMQQQAQQGSQAPKPGQDSYNPFDSGIQKAIASARESLGMNKQQQENAFNNSLLAFGDNMAQMPREKGFWNNVGSIGRALSPALKTYDQSENAAMAENQGMANQILAYQKAEQARQDQQEERAWHRQHAENQLGEQRRYHDLMNSRMSSGNRTLNPNTQNESIDLEGRSFRPLDKIEQRQANKFKKTAGNTYLAVKEINKSWDKLENLTKDNTFDPIGGYSQITNPVKDFFGRFANKENLKKETAARKDLGAKLGNLTAVLEAVKAGGGKLGQGMYDRLKPNFPDLVKDDYETIKTKMDSINKEMETYYKAAKISADYGINIDPNDIDEMENEQLQSQQNLDQEGFQQGNPNADFVLMQNANGEQFSIPRGMMQEAMNDPDEPLIPAGE